jgi:hypothetical protein
MLARHVVLLSLLGAGCSSISASSPDVPGMDLLPRLAGLWSGPAQDTRLGDFPLKNMDLRAAGDSVLFGRVDLDAANSLRFAFAVELHEGQRVLVFRNGGLFMGLSRDTRTRLVDSDGSRYRFCAFEAQDGCDYVEATFTFSGDDQFELRVLVRGVLHEVWTPTRVESRQLPAGFPVRTDLAGDADFPPMPGATVAVEWPAPLAADADVWLILSTTSCLPDGACHSSRAISARAEAGATAVTIPLDQVHPGRYSLLAVVDGNSNMATTRLPDHGDLVSVPSPSVDVASAGMTSTTVTASFAIP